MSDRGAAAASARSQAAHAQPRGAAHSGSQGADPFSSLEENGGWGDGRQGSGCCTDPHATNSASYMPPVFLSFDHRLTIVGRQPFSLSTGLTSRHRTTNVEAAKRTVSGVGQDGQFSGRFTAGSACRAAAAAGGQQPLHLCGRQPAGGGRGGGAAWRAAGARVLA